MHDDADRFTASGYCQECLDEDDPLVSDEKAFLHTCGVCLRSPKIRRSSKHQVSWHLAGVYLDAYLQTPSLDRHSKYASPEPGDYDCFDCDEDVNDFDTVWREFGPPKDALSSVLGKRRRSGAATKSNSKGSPRASRWHTAQRTLQDIGLAVSAFAAVLLCCLVGGTRQLQRCSSTNCIIAEQGRQACTACSCCHWCAVVHRSWCLVLCKARVASGKPACCCCGSVVCVRRHACFLPVC